MPFDTRQSKINRSDKPPGTKVVNSYDVTHIRVRKQRDYVSTKDTQVLRGKNDGLT